MEIPTNQLKSYQRYALLTLFSIVFLIFIGGFVRATGSGMGCPDWPKCFGMWIPPTSVEQLPSNYQEIYSHRGYSDVQFNAVKTWIEYVNRLIGVFVGLFVIGLVYKSLFTRSRPLIALSVISLILILFQGWLGSIVVATVLKPVIISLHMILALLISIVVLFAYLFSVREQLGSLKGVYVNNLKSYLLFIFFLAIIQLFLGISLREQADMLMNSLSMPRQLVVENFDFKFYIHRSSSLLILGLFYFTYKKYKHSGVENSLLSIFFKMGWWGITVNIFTGILFAYFGYPAFAQPFHLLFGVALILVLAGSIISLFLAQNQSSIAGVASKNLVVQ